MRFQAACVQGGCHHAQRQQHDAFGFERHCFGKSTTLDYRCLFHAHAALHPSPDKRRPCRRGRTHTRAKTSDIRWIARVSRTRYRELLQAGVRVFEWNGTMIHAKAAIADGVWARVGSTNLNFSSWHFNRELDVIIEDQNTVAQLCHHFLKDLDNATEIVLNDIEAAAVRESRQARFRQLKAMNRQQAKAVARQMLELSQAFKGNWHSGSNIVDSREANAYLSLGLTLLGFAVLLAFAPYLLVVPIIVLLGVGGISTLIYALRQSAKSNQTKDKSS